MDIVFIKGLKNKILPQLAAKKKTSQLINKKWKVLEASSPEGLSVFPYSLGIFLFAASEVQVVSPSSRELPTLGTESG